MFANGCDDGIHNCLQAPLLLSVRSPHHTNSSRSRPRQQANWHYAEVCRSVSRWQAKVSSKLFRGISETSSIESLSPDEEVSESSAVAVIPAWVREHLVEYSFEFGYASVPTPTGASWGTLSWQRRVKHDAGVCTAIAVRAPWSSKHQIAGSMWVGVNGFNFERIWISDSGSCAGGIQNSV